MGKFVIFAHARSGSTSLAKVLGEGNGVNMAIEPFHQDYSKWNPNEPNYSQLITDRSSLLTALEQIFNKHNAMKVLQYQFPAEIYTELLAQEVIKIIFLRRRNYINAVISGLIAEQTDIWKKEDATSEVIYSQLKPLNISRAREMLDYVSTQMNYYEDFLEKNRKGDYIKLFYEDLYSDDKKTNIETIKRICKFLEIDLPSEEAISKHMLPSSAKISSKGEYEQIPNYEEVLNALTKPS
ncbi:MAG: sulfotransferase domain-containing protein [Candidatus Dojkabacteria bacterium]